MLLLKKKKKIIRWRCYIHSRHHVGRIRSHKTLRTAGIRHWISDGTAVWIIITGKMAASREVLDWNVKVCPIKRGKKEDMYTRQYVKGYIKYGKYVRLNFSPLILDGSWRHRPHSIPVFMAPSFDVRGVFRFVSCVIQLVIALYSLICCDSTRLWCVYINNIRLAIAVFS